jgi:hypothetical protein
MTQRSKKSIFMMRLFPKFFRQPVLFVLLGSIIITFLYCDKDNENVGLSSVDQCCATPHLEGVVGNAKVYVPNIFTPNNDGINDLFGVFSNDSVEVIESFIIKDKAGKTHFTNENFKADDFSEFWDGQKSNGDPYVGIFVFDLTVVSQNGQTASFSGEVCSCPCDEGSCTFQTVSNALKCTFGTQHNGAGGYEPSFDPGEQNCF